METKIIDGKKLASEVKNNLAEKIIQSACRPILAVILVGNNPASQIYVCNKQKAALEVGIECKLFELSATSNPQKLFDLIMELNLAVEVNGIIVQLPLPEGYDEKEVLSAINPCKDVDGFSPVNAGLLQENSSLATVAATPKGILYMLQSVHPDLRGKHAVIIGRSNIVGRPLSMLLLNHDCTVTIAHSKTENIKALTKQADILVAACGCPKLVKKDWIKEGCTIIDVGINRLDGKLCGDVDFDDVQDKVANISPVPGGVGPMTVAMLLDNTFDAWQKQNYNLKK